MGFFYDNCDYLNYGIIGVGTTESNCTTWEDMYTTATATKNAFFKAFSNYIDMTSVCISGEVCEPEFEQKIYIDFWKVCYLDYHKKYLVFWNMMTCTPQTGVQNETLGVPNISGGEDTLSFTVDYGDGTFDLTIAEEYQTLEAELMCCVKNVMVLLMGETFDDSTMSQFYQIV
jgi:hypothetical protein